MCRLKNNSSNTMNNQGDLGTQKVKSPETKLKVIEDCDLNDREFKIAKIKNARLKLNKLQENSEKQFNEVRNKIKKQKEYFTKRFKLLKGIKQKFWS